MRINRNMSAVLTNNQLKRTENKLSKSMERLASGFKINSAGDNPAGLAISNKMKAQIDGLDQAETNSTDAISTLQIADGALNEVSSMLQRISELSVQAANGTNSSDDRKIIQSEIDELVKEVDRISSSTEYNTKPLLDGTSDVRVYGNNFTRMNVSDAVITGTYEFGVTASATQATVGIDYSQLASMTGDKGTIMINDQMVTVLPGMTENQFYEQLRNAAEAADCDLVEDGGSYSVVSNLYGSYGEVTFKVSDNIPAAFVTTSPNQPMYLEEETKHNVFVFNGTNAEINLASGGDFSKTATYHADGNHVTISDRDGFSIDFLLDNGYTGDMKLEVTDIGPMTIQIGANEYQTMEVRIPEISSESMYLDWIDVTSEKGATHALDIMGAAVGYLNDARSRIGAFQNRLEYAQNSLAESQEDMTSAYSSLLDTDMAEEMTEYTQQNVLDQAAVSVLAQANELPDKILSLLS